RQSFDSAQDKAQGDISGLSFPARRYLGEIPAGKSQQVSIPIKAGLDIPDDQVTLTCTFSEANGFEPDPIEVTFETRAFEPPQLALADVGIDDASGNGMIEAGEVVTVMVRVQNRGRGSAEKVNARVNIGRNVFAAAGSETEFDLGTLAAGSYRDLQFQVYTNRRATEIPVSLTLTERHGRYGLAEAPLELPFNQPVRSIQQVVIAGKELEMPEIAAAGGLSIDIERDIPQGLDQRKDAVALIIANRRYRDPDVPDVAFAHRDGEFMKQYLVRTLGYREGNIFIHQDATLAGFRTALRQLRNAAKKNSDVFVYYTGHGAPDVEEKRGYFVPVDCNPNYVQESGVPLDEFYEELGDIKANSITVVIDACFSGASHQGMLIQNLSPIMLVVEDRARLDKNTTVFTSAAGEEVSSWYPEQSHSLYTYYFLRGLQGEADRDGDKTLMVGELQTYLEEQVPYMARRLHNRQQTPTVTPGNEEQVFVRYK
ncbi:MAG: caspase family protein, partial [Candidatus Neomarinimicrobiota bacterium]